MARSPEQVGASHGDETTVGSWGRYSWLSLLALQPFNQFGALRQIAALVLLICLTLTAWRAWQTRHFALPRPGVVMTLGVALVLWALVVSLFGPYPLDSLQALRKGLLIQLILVAGALRYVATPSDLRRALAWILGGFAVVTLLSAYEIAGFWISQGMSIKIPRDHGSWWNGYGGTGACMTVLLTGSLLLPGLKRWQRLAGGLLVAVATLLTVLYWSRTPLVVMVLGVLFIALLGRHWKLLGGFIAIAVCGVAFLATAPDAPLDRYRSLLSGKTYVTDSGLSSRLSVWEGVADVIQERPLMGYGYGWKKLAWVINDRGFAAKWKKDGGNKAEYFLADADQASYGRVNPHNYFLQAAFEVGIVGLTLALAFWALLLKRVAALLGHMQTRECRALVIAVFGLVGTYWLSNFTNGQWEGGLANVTLALTAGALALSRSRSTAV